MKSPIIPSDDIADRTRRFERLVHICQNLGKSEEVEHLLQSVVVAACELTNSQYSFILVYEQETDLLKYVAGTPPQKTALKNIRIPLENSLAGWVYTNSKPVILHDASGDPRIPHETERALGVKISSIFSMPLIFRGETIGVLEAVNKLDNTHYTEDDTTILDTLASQAAVATLSTLLFEETQRAYDEVKELEHLKSNFIAIASHELRTPLGLILGHATFLRELVKDEKHKAQLEIIVRNANRLKEIIEDLASVDSFQTSAMRMHQESFALDRLISRVIASNKKSADQKKISLVSQVPSVDLTIEGDEEKLAIAINNIVSNAITFTEPNGHVLVSVDKLPGYVQIAVIDDGIGIPTKDLQRVFERFYQVESHLTRRHGGMGLGLTVAKAMVDMHKGQIWAESVEGKGSKFSILLPVSSSRKTAAESVFQT